MSNERFLILITKKTAGEATEAELNELQALLQADETLAERYTILHKYLEESSYKSASNKDSVLLRTLSRIKGAPVENDKAGQSIIVPAVPGKKSSRIMLLKWWMSAAAVVIISVSVFVFTQNKSPQKMGERLVEKQNAKGIKSTIVLTDGSKIWLNADSKIEYPEVFTGNTREVHLNGEAFFEVAKNPAKPFIIHLANGTVRVLGTSFNIRAYDNEKIVETSVATGKVAFIPRYEKSGKKQDTIFLTPDNKVSYSLTKEEIIMQPTASAEDKAWTEGKLIFRAMLFEEIAVELERNFGKQVVFKNEEARNYRLTGSFQNNTLAEILYYLSKTKTFSYTISDEEIVISR
ncbi:MAG TPA: FecR domain-containing protein [Chitinophagaceae bacterium]|nr:FecR domain-containing protein [Chitinophagaceae bacterium]